MVDETTKPDPLKRAFGWLAFGVATVTVVAIGVHLLTGWQPRGLQSTATHTGVQQHQPGGGRTHTQPGGGSGRAQSPPSSSIPPGTPVKLQKGPPPTTRGSTQKAESVPKLAPGECEAALGEWVPVITSSGQRRMACKLPPEKRQ